MLNIITTPQILTDSSFTAYGGQTGTSTPAQRQAAYALAEGGAAEEIGTFVMPVIVTGTHTWPPMGQSFNLRYDRLRRIVSVTAIHDAGCDCAADAIELNGCAWVKSEEAAIIEVRECGDTVRASCNNCTCNAGGNSALQVRVVYEAGLPTGVVSDPRMLMGLTTAAQIYLDQITNPSLGEGGAGEPGVKSFRSLSYSETRPDKSFRMTAFGASARANFAANTLSVFKYRGAMKLGF